MEVHSVETPCLGNRSYVVVDGSSAIVVDPPRDIDRIETVLDECNATVDVVLETHRHADYVSGGLQLARRHRADYVVPPGEPEPRHAFTAALEGRTFGTGAIGVRVLATPGHTPHHVAYVVQHEERPVAVCTGGSLLHGSVGRTDLYGAHRSLPLAREQWRSVRRLAATLPPDVRLLPTHGFGSLCSAAPGADTTATTVGEERLVNPALQLAEHVFASSLVEGYGPIPRHYERLPLLNAAGPAPVVLGMPRVLEPADLQRRLAEGDWLVDVRDRRSFAREHLRGSVNVEATGPLAAYLPWMLPPGAGVVLLGDAESIAGVARQLTQVGIDHPTGCAPGSPAQWCAGDRSLLSSYAVSDFTTFVAAESRGQAVALDVRSEQEWRAGHVSGALHLALPELATVLDPHGSTPSTLVSGETWVYCGGGFRAAVAASLLDAAGGNVTLIDQPYAAAADAGLTVRDRQQRREAVDAG